MVHYASYYRWLVTSRHLNIDPQGSSALDVGCDDGFFLSQTSLPIKVGVDLEPHVQALTPYPVLRANGSYLPFPDQSFDNVFAFDVIEHTEDDDAFLQSLIRVLAKGGQLWLSTPTSGAKMLPGFLTDKAELVWRHVRRGYSAKDIRDKLPLVAKASFIYWNAPFFRSLYVPLKLISMVSPGLARVGAQVCAWLDSKFPKGASGQLFVTVARDM